jgi:hypothetical protein
MNELRGFGPIGRVEYWNDGLVLSTHYSIIPTFQHSSVKE